MRRGPFQVLYNNPIKHMKSFLVDQEGYYGEFGGAYIPEILHRCVEDLQKAYLPILESEDFRKEYDALLLDAADGDAQAAIRQLKTDIGLD